MNKKDVFSQLENVSIKVEKFIDGYGNEKRYEDFFKNKLEANNINAIYKEIDVLERGLGVDRSRNQLYELLNEAYDQNQERLFCLINQKESILDIYFFIKCLNKEMLCKLLENPKINNPHLIFMCVRELTNGNRSIEPEEDEDKIKKVLATGLIKISNSNKEIWCFSISYLENKPSYYELLGSVLDKITDEALLNYAKTINIGINESILNQVTSAFESLTEEMFDSILKVVAVTIYMRWKEYIIDLKQKKQFFNGIVLTGYTNLIYWSIFYSISDIKDFINEFVASYQNFNNDVFRWYRQEIDFNTNFFVSLTQLDLLAQVCIDKKFKLINHCEIVDLIKQLKLIILRYDYLWDKSKVVESNNVLERIVKLAKFENESCLAVPGII